MRTPSKETIEALRRAYPAGCTVELVQMDDPQAPPIGTEGTVLGVDDMLYGRGVCLIEWSEKIMDELPKKTIILRLEPHEDGSRTITLENWNNGDLD